ncbi:probable G-protein coupled receptor 139 [Rhincodon typus]|uniref:probable G-protein coupled receptor 139 n=1 Tax=Rhincodon typus TaxID=259920 RepID=UPI00202E280B|nr:probable G-protein coupled receptor 139 [Rhincodon typus]
MHASPNGLVFAIYYPILGAMGVPANLVVIVILARRRCGLSECIIYYVISMAVTDLLVIITAVILHRTFGIYFPFSFLSITPVCSLLVATIYVALDSSVWLTVAFTFDRFIAICCQKLKIKYCTKKTTVQIIGIVPPLACVKNIFMYFICEPVYTVENVPWFCRTKPIFYTSPAWTAYDWIRSILTPCLPFILISLFNALTVRHILASNTTRRKLRTQSIVENQSDPEVEKRQKSIVLLFAISGSFIVLNMLYFVTILYVRIADVRYFSDSVFSQTAFNIEEIGYMLQFFSSCTNPFIYAGTQSKFRFELKREASYQLSRFVKLFKF